ncbi:MAG: type II toxin-antitoxin system VapC family toxin [Candidatus Freyarchaeota archaeon]|nr:PIN domain-containing protein [Candidatus Freyrarchaeum guaymaensis]
MKITADTDLFISHFAGDEHADYADKILEEAERGKLKIYTSSMMIDDLITAYRSQGYTVKQVVSILQDLQTLTFEILPLPVHVAIEAMKIYSEHKGSRKLHYFDAFIVATAKLQVKAPLVTTDRYILENQEKLQVKAVKIEDYAKTLR